MTTHEARLARQRFFDRHRIDQYDGYARQRPRDGERIPVDRAERSERNIRSRSVGIEGSNQ